MFCCMSMPIDDMADCHKGPEGGKTDGLMAKNAYDTLVSDKDNQGFNFNFNFTAHHSWDTSVTVEEFNQLVNEAANMVGGI